MTSTTGIKRRQPRKAEDSAAPASAPPKSIHAAAALPSASLAELGAGGAAMPPLEVLCEVWNDAGLRQLQEQVISATGMNAKADASGMYSKLPGPLPGVLSHDNLKTVQPSHWVTAKLDGVRQMLFVTLKASYLIDRLFVVRRLHHHLAHIAKSGPILLDGELCWDADAEQSHADSKTDADGDAKMHRNGGDSKASAASFRFMAFDCMIWDAQRVSSKTTAERLACLEQLQHRKPAGEQASSFLPVLMKPMFRVPQLPALLQTLDTSKPGEWSTKLAGCTFFVDGLVFMADNDGYAFSGRDSLIKWKEIHTIDVLTDPWDWPAIPAAGSTGAGDAKDSVWFPVNLYHLGPSNASHNARSQWPLGSGTGVITRRVAADVQRVFEAKSGADSKEAKVPVVVECAFDPQSKRWIVLKPREDKDMPNYISIINSTIATIAANLTVPDLLRHMARDDKGAVEAWVRAHPAEAGSAAASAAHVGGAGAAAAGAGAGAGSGHPPSPAGRGRKRSRSPSPISGASGGGVAAGAAGSGQPPAKVQRTSASSSSASVSGRKPAAAGPRADAKQTVAKVSHALGTLIADWKKNADWELEVRVLETGGVQGELSNAAYQSVLQRQKQPPAGYLLQPQALPPQATVDVFFRIPGGGDLKSDDGTPVRVRATESYDAKLGQTTVTERMIKTTHRVAEVDLSPPEGYKGPRFYLRVTAKSEKILPLEHAEAAAGSRKATGAAAAETPSAVREKKRASFRLGDDFRMDFTMVRTGDSREDARSASERPEIEFEMLRSAKNLGKSGPDMAGSLLSKLLAMLGLPLDDTRCCTNGVFDARKQLVAPGFVPDNWDGSGGDAGGSAAGAGAGSGAGAGAGAGDDAVDFRAAEKSKLAKKKGVAGFEL